MYNFTIFFTNLTWFILPLMVFLIYEAYSENMNNKKNNTILDFALLTCLYLVIRFGNFESKYIIGVTIDGIIALMYLKKRNIGALITSVIGIFYFKDHMIYFILKYIALYPLTLIYKNDKKYYLISNLSICIICLLFVNYHESIYYIICYIIIYLINLLFSKAEKIISINISYKEVIKEEKLRNSLFKISHEIKNPIAVIKGYLDMLDINNTEHYKKYIPIIKSEINRTLNLLQDFSACNKINLNLEIMDIELLLEDIKEKFSLMFDKKEVEFNIEEREDEIYINGDYNRLNQVLVNMIKNSVEALDNNKKSYINIKQIIEEENIKIMISDNGIGIKKEIIDKISEPFFTTKQNGTGLGVNLSKEIINAHGGNIKYESIENEGTTVTITLPIYK